MIRIALSAFAALLALAAIFAMSHAEPSPFDAVPPPNGPSVMVKIGPVVGSATHIGGGVLLSANHVIGITKTVRVKFADASIVEAEVLWVSRGYDIALLRYKDRNQAEAANIACRDPIVGEPIRAVGAPQGVENITRYGQIAGTPRQFGPWAMVSPTDVAMMKGMSGGGIFDAHDNLIGISVGALADGQGEALPFVVPASAICPLLARA